MDRIRNKYNPEVSELKAEKALTGVSKGEFESWRTHPCTRALNYTLESELDRLVLNWVKGGFADKTADGTALLQHRAIGMSEAIEGVMTYIEDMLENTQREDIYEEAIRSTQR